MLVKNYVKHLTIIRNNFSRITQVQKNNEKLLKINLTQTNRQKKTAQLKEGNNVISDKKALLTVWIIVLPVLDFTRAK